MFISVVKGHHKQSSTALKLTSFMSHTLHEKFITDWCYPLEYTNIAMDGISCCCASSRRTAVTFRSKSKQSKTSEVSGGHTKTNILQQGRAKFKSIINCS